MREAVGHSGRRHGEFGGSRRDDAVGSELQRVIGIGRAGRGITSDGVTRSSSGEKGRNGCGIGWPDNSGGQQARCRSGDDTNAARQRYRRSNGSPTSTSAGDTGQLRNWRVAQQVGARCDKDEALPNTGIIPLEQDEGGGGTTSPLLLLLALWPRLWRRS